MSYVMRNNFLNRRILAPGPDKNLVNMKYRVLIYMKYQLLRNGSSVPRKKSYYHYCNKRFATFVATQRPTYASITLIYSNIHPILDVAQIYIPIRDACRLQLHCHLQYQITMVEGHGFMDCNNKMIQLAAAAATKILLEVTTCCPWTLVKLQSDLVV